ncbi:PpGpp synthetase catalytic domain-containing protein (RelA/SpoT-type nucleotidyltranferase) [Microbacterium sp. Nx66]|uniref:GTP pyrophosphokinase n=1 Tax=Microbacterium sp. Nx66 TaxID=2766784 RepID=UPI0016575DB6|nr:RelA/SpoT domain-containing protein [Microbacterium sp. Nx66]CAD5138568.1 PpGpp synthetase catalytic domain-containing protein (RelA/SpoT-type nucleotidyltranferase) [Microbacterium sp. Nx66]
MSGVDDVDYTSWDWLPRAANEAENYVRRLLAESSIQPHDVSARAKSIASFQRKQRLKQYDDPMAQITDIVALRIITYSNTDRDRVRELIRTRFAVLPGEDRNPGREKPDHLRGYDCLHIVVSGESEERDSDWMVSGGDLERYFTAFGGLEVQIRTVAGHAWAEFEHARRYKGAAYHSISVQDRETIDRLFGAASDARSALDETFVAIDRILARPTIDIEVSRVEERPVRDSASSEAPSDLDIESLARFLASRFSDDAEGSAKGVEFGLELVRACRLQSIDQLEATLEDVDSDQVRALMDSGVPVTRVRRLDDELLAHFGQEYIELTKSAGNGRHRALQLEWRYDRLRGKTRYRTYLLSSRAPSATFNAGPYTAVGALREVVRMIAGDRGREAVVTDGLIDVSSDLPPGTRAKEVLVDGRGAVWVASNLNRESSERLMADLLRRAQPFDLRVQRGDVVVADGLDGFPALGQERLDEAERPH